MSYNKQDSQPVAVPRKRKNPLQLLMSLHGLYEEMRDEGWYCPSDDSRPSPDRADRKVQVSAQFPGWPGKQALAVEG